MSTETDIRPLIPFTCADRLTYLAVYPPAGIHCLTRTLDLEPGEAVYRPESIDG